LLHGKNIAVFNPAGTIAYQEKGILIFIIGLGLSIVIPTIIAAYIILWKYQASNTKSAYTPDWDSNKSIQFSLLFLICAVIAVVAYFDWKSSHDLDPYKPINAKKQLTVQVVAMRWKWLFIYPKEGIATVNYLRFPAKTALNFQLTADAPMNGFWIPQLGGQMYAMNGMSSTLHLLADKTGTYTGRSSNISGDGFAGMIFTAQATSQTDFDTWVSDVKSTSPVLDIHAYNELAKPSQDNKPAVYRLGEKDLYNTIIMKYMSPKPIHVDEH
jgi:cytochrome o ubiquinol oxidase subunit 2